MTTAFVLTSSAATAALVMVLPLEPLLEALLVLWIGLAALASLRANAPREVMIPRELIVDGSFVAPWLTIIRWRPAGAWLDRTVVVLPDMLPADTFRALRLRLRWE